MGSGRSDRGVSAGEAAGGKRDGRGGTGKGRHSHALAESSNGPQPAEGIKLSSLKLLGGSDTAEEGLAKLGTLVRSLKAATARNLQMA
ncbi:unnamed protein product [Closterium sp. NIES-54]